MDVLRYLRAHTVRGVIAVACVGVGVAGVAAAAVVSGSGGGRSGVPAEAPAAQVLAADEMPRRGPATTTTIIITTTTTAGGVGGSETGSTMSSPSPLPATPAPMAPDPMMASPAPPPATPAPTVPGLPGAPGSVAVSEAAAEVTVTWAVPAETGGAAITAYVVEYSAGGGAGWTAFRGAAGSDTSATVTGLVNGTAYLFRVAAVNVAGTGGWSAPVVGVPRTVAGAPVGLVATGGPGRLAVSWTAPGDGGGAVITDYVVEYRVSSSGEWTAVVDGVSAATSASVSGLENGTAYDVRVAAVNVAGAGAWSAVVSGVPRTVPGAPVALGATPGTAGVALSWVAPTDDGGGVITDYSVQFSTDGVSWTTFADDVSTAASATVTGLANSTTYAFRVAAVNVAGLGDWSAIASATTATPAFTQLGLDIDGEAAGDRAGTSVDVSADGTVLAVGAPYNDGATGADSGQVRVYAWNGTAWVQRGADIDGEAAGDYAGTSVALSADGTVLAVGARGNDANGSLAGQARVYVWNGSAWVQRGADIDGEAAGDQSGWSVALSADGTVLAVGAIFNDGNGSNSGHVRVHVWNGAAWVQRGGDIDGEAGAAGWSVALSADGTVLAVGAPFNTNGNGTGAGHARVHVWNGTAWVQRGADIDGEAGRDQSGIAVALSADGTVLAVGANLNDDNGSNAGHARVYVWNGSAWVQRGADIDGEAAGDQSGISLALSADGTVLAVGAIQNVGNGSDAGQTRVYAWNSTSWVQRGADLDGEAAGDQAGSSVRLSSDGSIVAVGAPYNTGTGASAGHVRLHQWATPAQPRALTATPGVGQVTLSWTAPVFDGSSGPVTDYVVQHATDGGATWTTFADGVSTATSATIAGLTNGTTYLFRVAASNAAGAGRWSATVSATPT